MRPEQINATLYLDRRPSSIRLSQVSFRTLSADQIDIELCSNTIGKLIRELDDFAFGNCPASPPVGLTKPIRRDPAALQALDGLPASLHLDRDPSFGSHGFVIVTGGHDFDLVRSTSEPLDDPRKSPLVLAVHITMDMRRVNPLG